MGNAERRLNFLTYVGCAAGPLSILGSSLILVSIYKTKTARNGKPLTAYHRLLMGVAILDIFFSIALTLGPLPMPKETGFEGSHGNTATCTVQGLFFQWGFGTYFYSACLMVYYMLVVCFNITDEKIARLYEPLLHFLPLGYSLATSILGLVWEVFNPQAFRCWVGVYPVGCDFDDSVECERGGDRAETFGLWLTTYPLIGFTAVTLICLSGIFWTVLKQIRASRKFFFNRTRISGAHGRNKMQMVVTQCYLYGLFYLNSVIWGVILTFISIAGRPLDLLGKHFWLAAIIYIFFPLQGFFFFLIYIRPRYLTLRERFPDDSQLQTLFYSVWDPELAEESAPQQRKFSSIQQMKRSLQENGASSNMSKSEKSNDRHVRIGASSEENKGTDAYNKTGRTDEVASE